MKIVVLASVLIAFYIGVFVFSYIAIKRIKDNQKQENERID